MGKIYVVGLGPGGKIDETVRAQKALNEADVIIGYKTYTDLIKDRYPDKEIIASPMRGEVDRCRSCLALAREGKCVALICSGDAGVYGMASPMLEVAGEDGFDDIEIIPGVTAALSGAALLGAPVAHDMCTVSLSDILTPWDVIEKRLACAAEGDFCIVIYNPASTKRTDHLKRACEILMRYIPGKRECGYVRNIGREGCSIKLLTLVTAFIGNSSTYISGDRLITPRGYGRA